MENVAEERESLEFAESELFVDYCRQRLPGDRDTEEIRDSLRDASSVFERPATISKTQPNPFSPMTTVKFENVLGQRGSIRVFNPRGELVATLHNGELTTELFQWDGRDHRGSSAASGVHLIRAEFGGELLS